MLLETMRWSFAPMLVHRAMLLREIPGGPAPGAGPGVKAAACHKCRYNADPVIPMKHSRGRRRSSRGRATGGLSRAQSRPRRGDLVLLVGGGHGHAWSTAALAASGVLKRLCRPR